MEPYFDQETPNAIAGQAGAHVLVIAGISSKRMVMKRRATRPVASSNDMNGYNVVCEELLR